MVTHVHRNYDLRNRTINNTKIKTTGIFMKDKAYKMASVDKELDPMIIQIKDPKAKKWEPMKNTKAPYNEKEEHVQSKPVTQKDDKVARDANLQSQEHKCMNLNFPPSTSMNMFFVLSQTTIKVPLSEMFKIEEHKKQSFGLD